MKVLDTSGRHARKMSLQSHHQSGHSRFNGLDTKRASGNNSSSSSIAGGNSSIRSSGSKVGYNYSDKNTEYVLKSFSEFVLQENGTYKIEKSGNVLVPSAAGEGRQIIPINDHPFAPPSADELRPSLSSHEMINYRNSKNLDPSRTRSSSSGYSSLPSRNKSSYQKAETNMVLAKVVGVLEATPPQFLVAPDTESRRALSPTPTLMSSVGVNTLPAPPNTGHGRRNEDRSRRRALSREVPAKYRDVEPNSRLFPHHSSPELYRDNYKAILNVGGRQSRSPSPNTGLSHSLSPAPTSSHYLSPVIARRATLARIRQGQKTNDGSSSISEDTEETKSTSSSSRTTDFILERPVLHLTPTPSKRMSRRKSTGSTLSVSPSEGGITLIDRGPNKSPLRKDIHGLVSIK